MSLEQYLKSFSRLRTDKNRKRWSALTTYQVPHKPFLLLSIMDLITQGSIAENFIEPSLLRTPIKYQLCPFFWYDI
jgi:putative restriction endonuclease